MKKTLLYFSLFAFSVANAQNPDPDGDIAKYPIKGKMKEIVESHYRPKEMFGEIEKGDFLGKTITRYNQNNQEVSVWKYNALKEFTERDTLIYNPKGLIVEKYTIDNNGDKSSWSRWKYNENGKEIESTELSSSGEITFRYESIYDSNGNEVEWTSYNYSGAIYQKGKSKYDSYNRCIEYNLYSSDGKLKRKMTYKYDSKGHKIEQTETNPLSSHEDYKMTYKYDSYGNCIEERKTNNYNALDITTYKYNSSGKCIETKSFDCDGCEVFTMSTRTYDKMGNRTGTVFTAYKVPDLSFEYTNLIEYDKTGNWIKFVYLKKDGSPYEGYYDERIIQYY